MTLTEFLLYCVPEDLLIRVVVDIPKVNFEGYIDEYLGLYGYKSDYRNIFLKNVDVESGTLVIYGEV